jgi:hypothetical protein
MPSLEDYAALLKTPCLVPVIGAEDRVLIVTSSSDGAEHTMSSEISIAFRRRASPRRGLVVISQQAYSWCDNRSWAGSGKSKLEQRPYPAVGRRDDQEDDHQSAGGQSILSPFQAVNAHDRVVPDVRLNYCGRPGLPFCASRAVEKRLKILSD